MASDIRFKWGKTLATVQKTVRFFDTTHIDEHGTRAGVEEGFWTDLINDMASWSMDEREYEIAQVSYLGRSRSPKRPARPHIQVERIRDLSEQLNRSNVANGDVEPLQFDDPDDRVSEPTFIVPFGTSNRVAVMSPAVQATRPETLGRWLTGILDLATTGESIELTPVVDPAVLEKIASADGAVMLEVHVDAGADIPDTGGGNVGKAFRKSRQQELEDARLQLRWSLDRSGGTASVRDSLKQGALWVANNAFSSNAKVRLVTDDGQGGLHREFHSIFDDRITQQVSFHTASGERAPEEAILIAIGDAIRQFLAKD